jgi:hypothetical protein
MQLKNIAVLGASAAIAAVGIGLGAGGSAYADSLLGSAGIRDNSVRSVDVHDGGIKRVDLSDSINRSLAKHGEDGVDGKNGVDGKDGKDASPSAAGAGYADWPTATPHHDLWAPHSYGETVQVCKAGEFITGGGYSSFGGFQGDNSKDLGGNNKDVTITVSAPYVASDADYKPISSNDSRFHADRWVVRGYNNSDQPVDVRAWALCAPLG